MCTHFFRKSLISFVIFLISLSFVCTTAYACLTRNQTQVLNEIANQTNVSNTTLISIFTMLCSNDTSLQNQITDNAYQIDNLNVRVDIVNESLSNLSSDFENFSNLTTTNLTELRQMISELNQSLIDFNNTFSNFTENYTNAQDNIDYLENLVNEFMSNTTEKLNEFSEQLDVQVERINNKLEMANSPQVSSFPSWWWVPLAAVGLISILYYYRKTLPVSKVGAKYKTYSGKFLSASPIVKREKEMIKRMEMRILEHNFPSKIQTQLLNDVYSKKISNEKELEKEIKEYDGIVKRRKNIRKGYKAGKEKNKKTGKKKR